MTIEKRHFYAGCLYVCLLAVCRALIGALLELNVYARSVQAKLWHDFHWFCFEGKKKPCILCDFCFCLGSFFAKLIKTILTLKNQFR